MAAKNNVKVVIERFITALPVQLVCAIINSQLYSECSPAATYVIDLNQEKNSLIEIQAWGYTAI